MIYYIAIPESNLNDKEIYEVRMQAIHQLESEGHSARYTMFDSTWWNSDSLNARGIKHKKLHFFAKMLEEISKCDGVYFLKGWQADNVCNRIHESLTSIDTIDVRHEES